LQKLQIKNINAFEHIEKYRDRVGRRVLKKDRKDAGALAGGGAQGY